MTKTIAEIWNGNLDPVRYYGVDNHETKLLEALMARHAEKLEKELGEQAKDIFSRYCECVNDYVALMGRQAFCDGFCLGGKIVAEALVAPLPME